MNTATRSLLAALLGLLVFSDCYGTHITGGEITFRHDPNASTPYAYQFTLKIYRDGQGQDAPGATLNFGLDGVTQTVPVRSRSRMSELIAPNMEVLVYVFQYTYPGPGTYIVSFTENNRNAEVVNLFQSINTPFHIQTFLTISATLGVNSGPELLNPPIFRAVAGRKVCINPVAYDAEGDSLSYRLIAPFGSGNTEVNGYRFPDQVTPPGVSESGGAPTFTINELTGDICWDAPGLRRRGGGVLTDPGDYAQYAVAFVVEEWRGKVLLSSTARDFLITVTAPEGPAPELRLENAAAAGFNADRQVRVEPGQRLAFPVLYKSLPPGRDSLIPVSTTLPPSGNAAAAVTDSAGFTKVTYSWTPTATDRRRHPYLVVFRGSSTPAGGAGTFFNDLTFSVFVGEAITPGQVTATEDEVNGHTLRLFPNPTRSKVRLARVPGTGAVRFQLTDALGRQVYTSADLRGANFEVDLTALPNGLYAYTVTAGGRVVGKGRLLKQ
ncbi:MAG: T9SS type A sorting domain-containing protein [Cytophagales bacterium]|nr:T9SS type A sorting domain-containing protein [Cytophagales bacterium]